MSTPKMRREELAAQRAELAAQLRSVRRSVRRAGARIDWSDPANRRYNPLPAKTPDLGRLNGPQLDALKRRLDAWRPRRLQSTASGQIIPPEEVQEMRRIRKRAYDRAYRAARRINVAAPPGSPRVTAQQLLDQQGAPVRPRSARSVKDRASYRRLAAAAESAARRGPAARQRSMLNDMLGRAALPDALRRRIARLSDAGILYLRSSGRAMSAIKDLYLAHGEESDFSGLERAVSEAEAV